MSRIELKNQDETLQVVVGYDNGLQSFYAQLFHITRNDSEKDKMENDFMADDNVEEDDMDPFVWLGTKPYEVKSADELAEKLKPYYTLDEAVINQLKSDFSREASPPTELQKQMFNLMFKSSLN